MDMTRSITHYVGLLDGSGDVWGVRIVDILGCVGAGPTPDAAIEDVSYALRDVVAYKQNGGYPVPPPSTLEQVLASDEFETGDVPVMIPLLLDAGLLEAIDEAAKRRGVTRSAFLADAAPAKPMAA